MKVHYLPREQKLERFGAGPWMDEPDHAQWSHNGTGFPCITVRISTGAWAAYVGVGPTHPLHRVSHHELVLDEAVVVSSFGYGCFLADGTPIKVEADPLYWFFGFDFSHGDDLIPQFEKWRADANRSRAHAGREIALRSLGGGTLLEPAYADFTFVRMRAELLAAQLEHPDRIFRRSARITTDGDVP